jgi:hypothetical protein
MEHRNAYLGMAVIALVIAFIIAALLQPKDTPTTSLGRAAEEISDGFEDAGRELDPNRTTGEKVGDAIEDIGEDIQDASEE